jgi:hypothetical protein
LAGCNVPKLLPLSKVDVLETIDNGGVLKLSSPNEFAISEQVLNLFCRAMLVPEIVLLQAPVLYDPSPKGIIEIADSLFHLEGSQSISKGKEGRYSMELFTVHWRCVCAEHHTVPAVNDF